MDLLLLFDFLGTALGLLYLWLEYKANIWLWLVSLTMYAIDLWIYFDRGLYAKFGIALFSPSLVVYGWTAWGKRKKELRIRHVPRTTALLSLAGLGVLWGVIFYLRSRLVRPRRRHLHRRPMATIAQVRRAVAPMVRRRRPIQHPLLLQGRTLPRLPLRLLHHNGRTRLPQVVATYEGARARLTKNPDETAEFGIL